MLPNLIVRVSEVVVWEVVRSESEVLPNSEDWVGFRNRSSNVLNGPLGVFVVEIGTIISMKLSSGALVPNILARPVIGFDPVVAGSRGINQIPRSLSFLSCRDLSDVEKLSVMEEIMPRIVC